MTWPSSLTRNQSWALRRPAGQCEQPITGGGPCGAEEIARALAQLMIELQSFHVGAADGHGDMTGSQVHETGRLPARR